jgi:hypothetical protein
VDDYVPRLRSISNWKIQSSENFLLALLLNRQDKIAQDFTKFYLKDTKPELMVFCLRNQNEQFLKFALNESIFAVNYFEQAEVRDELMQILEHKANTTMVLNVLLYADFSIWP